MITNLIIQKDVIDDLYLREDEFKSFLKFIKKNFRNYTLVTDFSDEEDFKKRAVENPLLELLLDKFEAIKYIENLDEIIINEDFLNDCALRTIVLSDRSKEECNKIINQKSILFFCLENLNEWNIYEDIVFAKNLKITNDKNYPIDQKFNSFDDISKYFKNCKSFIIFDKYILCNKTNQKKEKNLFPLIEALLKSQKNDIQFTIITEFKNEEIVAEFNEIKSFLQKIGCKNFNLNLIHHDKAFYPKKVEHLHSRYIFSNYIHITCNDSFNFFKDNNTFNNLADIQVKLSISNTNLYSYKKDLDLIKTYVSKITNNDKLSGNLKVTYFCNKDNLLLN